MLKHILKIVTTNEYIYQLPNEAVEGKPFVASEKEMSNFKVTQDKSMAEDFLNLEEIYSLDLGYLENCYAMVYKKRIRMEVEVISIINRDRL